MRLRVLWVGLDKPEDLEPAFASIIRERADALYVLSTYVTYPHRHRIADFAVKRRLPSMRSRRDASRVLWYAAVPNEQRQREAPMLKLAHVTAMALAAGLSATAAAQATVGEVLDAGGKKLAKDELMKLIAGATVSGQTQSGGQFQTEYKSDGTFTGTLQNQQMKGVARFGTWTIDDAGSFCTDTNSRSTYGARQDKSCGYFYKVGEKYFVALDSDERGTRVLERVIKK
jgi:hypothetical protein